MIIDGNNLVHFGHGESPHLRGSAIPGTSLAFANSVPGHSREREQDGKPASLSKKAAPAIINVKKTGLVDNVGTILWIDPTDKASFFRFLYPKADSINKAGYDTKVFRS